MSQVVDGNLEYMVGKSGNYLTKRKKTILDVYAPSVESNAIVLTEDMTGRIVVLPDASAGDADVITLPATPASGTYFKFLVGVDLTQNFVMAGVFEGGCSAAGGYEDLAATTSITFTKTKAKAGDYLNCMYHDGKWYVDGIATTAGSYVPAS